MAIENRGLGYIPDTLDLRDFSYHQELSVGLTGAGSADLRKHRGARLEQGPASSCVGFAITRALQLAASVEHRPDLPMPSPSFIYWNARRAETHGPGGKPEFNPAVIDRGCYPRVAMKALQTFGYASMEAWPYDLGTIDQQPSFKAYRSAYDQRGFRYYRIEGETVTGRTRSSQVAEALSSGYPVIFGAQVDDAFMRHDSQEPITGIDPRYLVGGHMMTVLAISGNSLIVDNWWGKNWGGDNDGMGVLDRDFFDSDWIHDCYALSVQPMGDR